MLYLGLWWDRWHPEATSRPVLLLDEKLRSGLRSGQRRPLGRDRTAQSGLYSAEESVSGVLKCKKRYYVISAVLSTEGEGGGEGEGVKRAGGTLRGRSGEAAWLRGAEWSRYVVWWYDYQSGSTGREMFQKMNPSIPLWLSNDLESDQKL